MDTDKVRLLEDAGISWSETVPRLLNKELIYVKHLKRMLTNEYYPRLLEKLDAGDCADAFELSHTLRGTAGNLGIVPMYECLCKMTEELRISDLEAAKRRRPELTAAHDMACAAISKL